MIIFLNSHIDVGFHLISIYQDNVFVFEKDKELCLSQTIKPSEDNKSYIDTNSIKEQMDSFLEAIPSSYRASKINFAIRATFT